ncbi:hypothetical protein AAEX28_06505 [Lentisphaerota bacterium WC36G]|nr:hypothetical protein LJT99_09370 [Lentisphaerae bacterium WC36]
MSFYMNLAKKSLLSIVSALAFSNMFAVSTQAEDGVYDIEKASAKTNDNPVTVFLGVTNNSVLNNEVNKMLTLCNWFDLKPAESKITAEYYIKGQLAGSILQLGVYDSNNRLKYVVNQLVDANDVSLSAAKAVDQVLNKIFKIQGICATKIAFAVQAKVGVKNIYIANFDSSNSTALTNNNNLCVEPSWTPRNQSLVYTRYNKSSTDIVEYSLARKQSRRLIQLPGLNSGGKVSPNGQFLAMVLSQGKNIDLYVRPINGNKPIRVTADSAVEAAVTWSPDSKQLCYVSDKTGAPRLYLMVRDGSRVRSLNAIGKEQASPDWSTDNKIVYAAKLGREYQIAVMDLKTGKNELITKLAGNWEEPSWAPDNRHVVCSRKIGGGISQLYIVDTKTKKVRPYMKGRYHLSYPVWSHIIK